jgi:hypothetical protein
MATRLGHWGNREMFLGANWSLIYKLRLHEESVSGSNDGVDGRAMSGTTTLNWRYEEEYTGWHWALIKRRPLAEADQ